MRRHYFDEADSDYRRPIVTHEFVDAKEMFDAHTYDKGAAVLHMLRSLLGDDLWWKGIRAYVAAHATSAVETNDFKVAMEKATGKALDGFFEQWLLRPGHPEFQVAWSWDPTARQAEVRVKQTQETKDGVPVFQTPVTLEIATDDRSWRETVRLEKRDHTFHFPCRQRPQAILFDPEGSVLKRLVFRRSAKELRWILVHSEHLWPRMEACTQLSRSGEAAEVIPILEETLHKDRQWAVRRAAAAALGEVGTPAARDALLRSISDQDSRVRAGIYEALGRFCKDELAVAALAKAYREDGRYYPLAAAASALGSTRHPKAFESLVAGMDRPSHAEVIADHAARGLVALRDERGIDILVQRTRYGEPEMRRYAVAIALGRLGRVLEGRRLDVLEHLVGLTKDPNIRTKLGAIEGLGELGSPLAVPALEKVYEGEVLWSFKKRARRALRRIRGAQSERKPAVERQKALDDLHEESRELRRRLDSLESEVEALRKPRR
jgi:aminopeptidase N